MSSYTSGLFGLDPRKAAYQAAIPDLHFWWPGAGRCWLGQATNQTGPNACICA